MGLSIKPAEWAIQHQPGSNVQATISRAADSGGRHIATALTATLSGNAAAGPFTVNLRDGATGAGTILWSSVIGIVGADSKSISLSNLQIEGTENTAMTLEFDAAGGSNKEETVSLIGYTSK